LFLFDQARFDVFLSGEGKQVGQFRQPVELGDGLAYQQRLFLPVVGQKLLGRQIAEWRIGHMGYIEKSGLGRIISPGAALCSSSCGRVAAYPAAVRGRGRVDTAQAGSGVVLVRWLDVSSFKTGVHAYA